MNIPTLRQNNASSAHKAIRFVALVVLVVLFLFACFETISVIVEDWFTFSASHGLLMFAVSVLMVWRKKVYLRRIEIRPSILPGILLTGLGCIMLVSGRLSFTTSLEKMSLIVILLGLVVLLGGMPYLKALYIPISYLIFTISVFNVILSGQLIYFQNVTAYIAATSLNLVGLPALRNGHLIVLPHIALDVAKSCSGINHITALVGLAIPLAVVTQKTRWAKILLVIEAFLIGILANGLRVFGIALWTFFYGNEVVHGPLDVFLVSSIFGFGFVALLLMSWLQGKKSLKGITGATAEQELPQPKQSSKQSYRASITAAVLLCITGGFLFFQSTEPVYPKKDLNEIPEVIKNWVADDVYQGTIRLEEIYPDSVLRRTYHNPEQRRIHLYVGYFNKQSREKKIFNLEYPPFSEKSEAINLAGDSGVALNLNHNKSRKGNVYFGYFIDGKLFSRTYLTKLAIIESTLLKRRSNAGIVIIETENSVSLNDTTPGVSQELESVKDIVSRIVMNG